MSETPQPEKVVIYIRSCERYVEQVDYLTRRTTGLPKQFLATYNNHGYSLQPLEPQDWIEHPTRLDVGTWGL